MTNKKHYHARYIRDLGIAAYTEGPDTIEVAAPNLHSLSVEVGCCNIDINFIYENENGDPIFKTVIIPLNTNSVEDTK